MEVPGTAATRAFSMASPPSESGSIDLVVRVLPGGAFSAALDERLAPGVRLRVSGPFGQLKVRLSHRPILMIACGSGLAPIESMAADLADRRNTRPVTVFFGVRPPRTCSTWNASRRSAGACRAWRSSRCCPSRGPARPRDQARDRRVHRRLPAARLAHLCGPPAMIDATVELVTRRGVRPRNVYFDAFVPTG